MGLLHYFIISSMAVDLLLHFAGFGMASSTMRAAKCVVPNGVEHVTRAALLQQCISKNYAQGNETQCYTELGCFPMDSPWTSVLRPFPSPLHPAEINVQLYCYTRLSPERFNITLWPEISLQDCSFKAERRTVFLTHGFASNGNSSWLSELKDRYLQEMDANVFLVDWGRGSELFNYLQVASNTRIVGAEVTRFIKFLRDQHGLAATNLHLIGHSLGAHISAYVAKAIPGVYRLTAMDAAQPGFESQSKDVRLDKNDALYVEVLHTNAAPFIPTLGFGLIFPHGHVDFYINGGLQQPGCHIPNVPEIKSINDLARIPVEVLDAWVSCSHGRSYEYYIQSLRNNCTIWGRLATLSRHIINAGTLGFIEPLFSKLSRCTADTCIPLGLETPAFKARGVFAATTKLGSPYCEDNPMVNSRILSEIKEIVDETSTLIPSSAVKAANIISNTTSETKLKLKGLVGL